jgi:hypothetical protein
VRRQDADDRETAIGKTKRSSFQIHATLENFFPKTVADNRDLIFFALRLGRNEATEGRRDAEHTEEISGHAGDICAHRFAPARHRLGIAHITCDKFEAAIARHEIVEVRLRKWHAAAGFTQFGHLDEAFLRWIRQGSQQQRIEHTKDRGRGTNP